jgi:hypothetical protein
MLMLPLIWNTRLYQDGFAGSIVSMVAYVATAVLVYKITLLLTRRKIAGVAAAGVFGLNVNMLYMQSTPMTEALLICMVAATVYWIEKWAYTGKYQYLVAGGVAGFFASLSRYESWPILASLVLVVIIIAWQHGYALPAKLRRARTRDQFMAFAVVAMAGIVGWVLWNWTIFGNPLGFQNGPYAKPALFLSNSEPAIGHWAVAAKTYLFAMADNVTWPMLLLAGVGLAIFIAFEWRSKRQAGRSLPVLSLLTTVPFFIVSSYTGERPLHVLQINHDLYDVRFGLIMLLPAAIFTGYLVGSLQRFKHAMYLAGALVLAIAIGLGTVLTRQDSVVTYQAVSGIYSTEAIHPAQVQVTTFLAHHYSGGMVLMEVFGNEHIAFHLPADQLVYEGTSGRWLPALRNPAASHISWVIARCGGKPDMLCSALGTSRLNDYQLVYRALGTSRLNDYQLVYRTLDRQSREEYYVYRLIS